MPQLGQEDLWSVGQRVSDRGLELCQSRGYLRQQLTALDSRERQVIRLRFGLDGDHPLTLRQVARQVGLSRERVRQIELGALLKIRRVL